MESSDSSAMRKRLGQLLLERGLVSQEQIERALEYQKKNGGLLGQILVKHNYVTEEEVVSALSIQFGFPYLPLSNYEINPEIVRLISEEATRRYFAVPIDKIGKVITVVMADPLNLAAIKYIENYTRCSVQTFVGTASDIKNAINRHYGEKGEPERKMSPEDNLGQIDFLTTARKSQKEKPE